MALGFRGSGCGVLGFGVFLGSGLHGSPKDLVRAQGLHICEVLAASLKGDRLLVKLLAATVNLREPYVTTLLHERPQPQNHPPPTTNYNAHHDGKID